MPSFIFKRFYINCCLITFKIRDISHVTKVGPYQGILLKNCKEQYRC